jgi:type I restriction enzyme S subunit
MGKTGDLRIDQIMPRLFESWETLPLEECLIDEGVSYKKLKKKDIKPTGKIPVIDHGENSISGYIDNESNAYAGTLPVIIFGDHTRRVKYIDFKFAIGADGTKLLHPFKALHPKFFFFYLSSLNLESQGYSRHYRFLKQIHVPLPPPQRTAPHRSQIRKIIGQGGCLQRAAGKNTDNPQAFPTVSSLCRLFRSPHR